MSDPKHDSIRTHLERHGVTDEQHVQAAIDAQEAGVDVEQIQADIRAGVPQWLALLRAILALLAARKGTAAPAAVRRKKE